MSAVGAVNSGQVNQVSQVEKIADLAKELGVSDSVIDEIEQAEHKQREVNELVDDFNSLATREQELNGQLDEINAQLADSPSDPDLLRQKSEVNAQLDGVRAERSAKSDELLAAQNELTAQLDAITTHVYQELAAKGETGMGDNDTNPFTGNPIDYSNADAAMDEILGQINGGQKNIMLKAMLLLVRIALNSTDNVALVTQTMSTGLDTQSRIRTITEKLQALAKGFDDNNGKPVHDMQQLFELAYGNPPREDVLAAVRPFEKEFKDIKINLPGSAYNGQNAWEVLKANNFSTLNADGTQNDDMRLIFNQMFTSFMQDQYGGLLNAVNNDDERLEVALEYPKGADGKPDRTKIPTISCAMKDIENYVNKGTAGIQASSATTNQRGVELQRLSNEVQTQWQQVKTLLESIKQTNTEINR